MNKNNKRISVSQKGFSLIELMIAVAILGVITSIAYPSYMKQVQKSKRTPAKVELMRVAQLQESYYVQNLSYAVAFKTSDGVGDLDFADTAPTTEGGDYTVSIAALPTDCDGTSTTPCTSYTIDATPVSSKPQSNDTDCTGFRLSSTGAKSAISSTVTTYGTASVRDTCWR